MSGKKPSADVDPTLSLIEAAEEGGAEDVEEDPTIQISASIVAQIEREASEAPTLILPESFEDGPDLPTAELPCPRSEVTLELEAPAGELPPALPFVGPSIAKHSPRDDLTVEVAPDATQGPALPFVVREAPSSIGEPATAPAAPPHEPAAPPHEPAFHVADVADVDFADVVHVAAIAAELVDAPVAVVLARRGLTAPIWKAVESEWAERLAAEAERGETTLRDAYDDAYLEARIARRGRFDLAAFAELLVELEAGALDAATDVAAVDIADAMRFRRAWRRRVVADATLAGRLEDALRAARARRPS